MLKKRILAFIAIVGVVFAPLYEFNSTYANEQNDSLKIHLEHVSQNGLEITENGGGYDISDTSSITITYTVENLIIGESYSIRAYGFSMPYSEESGIADSSSISRTISVNPSITRRHNNLFIDIYTPSREASFATLFYNTNPSFVEIGLIYIDSVTQGGNSILPHIENGWVFELNDFETFSIQMHTDVADDAISYDFNFCGNIYSYSGTELKNGFVLTGQCIIREDQELVDISAIDVNGTGLALNYISDQVGSDSGSTIRFYKNNSVPRISFANLEYLNYPGETISYIVDMRYHDQNNPLNLTFGGRNFTSDEDYDVTIKLYHFTKTSPRGEVEYEQTLTLSGQELNNGKTITLNNVVLELLNEENLLFDADMYELAVSYEGQNFERHFDYGYGCFGHLDIRVLTTDNNNEMVFPEVGGSRPGLGINTVNENVSAHFFVLDLPENEEFEYEIIKMPLDSLIPSSGEIVDSGVFTGKEMGTGKITLSTEKDALYYILIKNEHGIIRWTKASFSSNPDTVGIGSISASVDSLPLKITYDSSFPYYAIQTGKTVTFTLSGKNYNENDYYSIRMYPSACMGAYSEFGCTGVLGDISETKTFTGKEINDGVVSFELPYIEDAYSGLSNGRFDVVEVSFQINGVTSGQIPMVFLKYVDKSFTVKMTGGDTFEEESVLYISVDDYQDLSASCGGISAIMGDVEYDDTKLELIEAEALNDFELISGDHYVLHNIYGQGAPEGTNVLKLTFRNKGLESGESTTVSFTNISGSDGVNDITTADASKTITYYEPEASIGSDTYTIIDNLISKIATGTLVNIFKNGLELGGHATVRILSVNNEELSSTDKVGTGVKVQLLDRHGEVVSEFTIVIKGDISGDGEITITDLVKAKRHLAGLDNYTGVFQLAGDVSKTGAISITDVVKICRHVAGLEVINQ